MGIRDAFNAALIGGALTGSTWSQEATLPTRPENNPPPASSKQETGSTTKINIWTADRIDDELKSLKTTIKLVDSYFTSNSTDTRITQWEGAKDKINAFLSKAEQELAKNPNLSQLHTIGLALEAQQSTIAALFPPVTNNGSAHSSNSQINVPQVAIFDLPDFLAMKNMARIAGPLMKETFTKAGRIPTENEATILKGIEAIENAKNPVELSEQLMPQVEALLKAVKAIDQTNTRIPLGPLDELKKRLNALNIRPENNQSESNQTSQDITLSWHSRWMKLKDDGIVRLHQGARDAHDIRKFNELVNDETGFSQVKKDASTLYEFINNKLGDLNYAGDEKMLRLRNYLKIIRETESADKLPSNTLSIMIDASLIYQKQ